jgi:hypothetical protein
VFGEHAPQEAISGSLSSRSSREVPRDLSSSPVRRPGIATVPPMPVDRDSEQQAADVAAWLSRRAGARVRYERVAPGDEHVLPEREQRELDALPSRLDRDGD